MDHIEMMVLAQAVEEKTTTQQTAGETTGAKQATGEAKTTQQGTGQTADAGQTAGEKTAAQQGTGEKAAQQATEKTTGKQETSTQTSVPGGAPPDNKSVPPANKPNWMTWVPLILIMIVIYYFMLIKPRKRQQENERKMSETLKKNARVVTIGGIIGTVVDVKDDEVVIKIDESNNTRLRLVRRAISKILTEEEPKANQ